MQQWPDQTWMQARQRATAMSGLLAGMRKRLGSRCTVGNMHLIWRGLGKVKSCGDMCTVESYCAKTAKEKMKRCTFCSFSHCLLRRAIRCWWLLLASASSLAYAASSSALLAFQLQHMSKGLKRAQCMLLAAATRLIHCGQLLLGSYNHWKHPDLCQSCNPNTRRVFG